MICTVGEFDEVVDDLEFTEAHEKFMNFRKCLRAMLHMMIGTPQKHLYEAQKKNIETVKKPYTMTVHDFVERLYQMASYLPEFPRLMAATALSETDLKRNIIFHGGMPNAWQEKFVHANMCISSTTLVQMTNYLALEQGIADT
eukprot:scaffold19697_cov30-Attheya_sp.AAC.4